LYQNIEEFSPWPGKKMRKISLEEAARVRKRKSSVHDRGQRTPRSLSPSSLANSGGDVLGRSLGERDAENSTDHEVEVAMKKPRPHTREKPEEGGFRDKGKGWSSGRGQDCCRPEGRNMYASGSGSRLYRRDSRSPDQYQRSRNYDTRDDNSSYENDQVKTRIHQYDRSPSRQRDYYREVRYDIGSGGPKSRSHERYSPRHVKSEGRNIAGESRSYDFKRKKFVEVDRNGNPFGYMLYVLHTDLIAFAKEMDPSLNWERQPQDVRDRLEE
jgi:hypothetical protein